MTKYEDALQYFERKRDSARKRYEAALKRGDEVQALQLKVKARRMEVAVEAIGKAEKMPVEKNGYMVFCPNCGSPDSLYNGFSDRNNFCGNCGQALDWEE